MNVLCIMYNIIHVQFKKQYFYYVSIKGSNVSMKRQQTWGLT